MFQVTPTKRVSSYIWRQMWILKVPWLQVWRGSGTSHCETRYLLWPCRACIPPRINNQSQAPVSDMKNETCQQEAGRLTLKLTDLVPNYNITYSHSFNSLKDDGRSSATCSERLQTRGGLPQIHGCDQNPKEHLKWRGQYVSKTACLHKTLLQ